MPYILDILDDGCKQHRNVKLRWEAEDEDDSSEELEDFNVLTKDVDKLVHDYSKFWESNGDLFVVNRKDIKDILQ